MKAKIIVLLSLMFCISCNPLDGQEGISHNIEHSKEIKTFITEFNLLTPNNNLKGVKTIWIEYLWFHASIFEEKRINKNYQTLIFEFESADCLNKYDTIWALRETFKEYEKYNLEVNSSHRLVFCRSYKPYIIKHDTIRLNYVMGDLIHDKIVSKQEIILVAK